VIRRFFSKFLYFSCYYGMISFSQPKSMIEKSKINVNWKVIGHAQQKLYLESAFFGNRLTHSYLFSGPPHVGKTALALDFARLLNCENGNLCGKCLACVNPVEIFSELIVIDKDTEIKIDEIRSLKRDLALKPLSGQKKVAIIANAENLNRESANSLLKFLEEPQKDNFFILTTAAVGFLPQTIVSRVQKINFSPNSKQETEKHLNSLDISKAITKQVLELAPNKIGLANILSKNIEELERWRQQDMELDDLFSQSVFERMQYTSQISKLETQQIVNIFKTWLILSESRLRQTKQKDMKAQTDFIKALNTALMHFKSNLNKRLVLDNFVLSF